MIVSQSLCFLETFRVKHRVETMGVAGIYSKSAMVPHKASVSVSEAPEHRTAPSLRCVGLKLSTGLLALVAVVFVVAWVLLQQNG